jgi:hypothetical protein
MIGMFAKIPFQQETSDAAKDRGVGQAQRTKDYYPQSMAV